MIPNIISQFFECLIDGFSDSESPAAQVNLLVANRIRPRRVLMADGDQAYEDRKALSQLAGEGGSCCGDVDELDWPHRS
jgi:hypothetical protein